MRLLYFGNSDQGYIVLTDLDSDAAKAEFDRLGYELLAELDLMTVTVKGNVYALPLNQEWWLE